MAATGTLIKGYDGMEEKALFAELRLRSQVELTEVEAYERSHEDRRPVLDKLRYLRGVEPLDGYDALSAGDVVKRLGSVDPSTLLAARGYEKKLRHRPEVLGGINDLRTAGRPSTAAMLDAEAAAATGYGGSLTSRLALSIGAGTLMVAAVAMLLVSLLVTLVVVVMTVAPNALN